MIFQSLVTLYDRLAPAGDVPPFGFSIEDIGFAITIDREGHLVGQPEDLRTRISTNKYEYHPSIVPYSNKVNVRSSGAAEVPNFMVDKPDYIFGLAGTTKKEVHRSCFKQLVDTVSGDSNDAGIVAAKNFLRQWNPIDAASLENWKDMCGPHGKWVAFRLEGEPGFIHERSEVQKLWVEHGTHLEYPEGISFVDGRIHPLQRQYAQFKFGSGAPIVSFNEAAYESYGKKRGENAPLDITAEFKSSTALKYLLRSRTQRLRIAEATTVFWTERESVIETFMGQVLDPSAGSGDNLPVQKFLESVRDGKMPQEIADDSSVRFYILGLSPNKGRLAVRFWYVCSVDDMLQRLRVHFQHLAMVRNPERDIQFPGIWHLLKETAREGKDISPVLGGALTRSILTGARYPQNLFQGVMGRIRADQARKKPNSKESTWVSLILEHRILFSIFERKVVNFFWQLQDGQDFLLQG